MSKSLDEPILGRRIYISGVVQGVGFRPFIFGLAKKNQLKGWVCNTSAGVKIEINGGFEKLEKFEKHLIEKAPPLAKIEEISIENILVYGFKSFKIIQSQQVEDHRGMVVSKTRIGGLRVVDWPTGELLPRIC